MTTLQRRGVPLLERRSAMAVLGTALQRARSGRGAVVVVSGESGIGRSSLIRAFVTGGATEVRVLAGRAELPAAPMDPGGDVAAAMVAELSAEPTVLAIDDVHRADDATLDVLCHVARRIDGLPALLVLGVCSDELSADHPVLTLLGAAAVTHLDLAPLSAAAVTTLAGPERGPDLHRLTGGNPYLVTAALAGPLPDAVGLRFARLRPATISAVERVAMLPDAATARLVKTLLGDDMAALVEAEERGFITVGDDCRIAFRHELVRRAIVAAIPGRRRRALHAAVVTALRDLGATDPARLVHHAVAAGDAATVLEFGPAAARAAVAAGSHAEALAHLDAVAGYADRLPPVARLELFDELAGHLAIGRRFADAVAMSRRALALAADLGLADRHVALTSRLAHHLVLAGELDDADRLHDATARRLRATGTALARAEIALLGADLRVRTGRYAEAGPLLRQARALAAEAGEPGPAVSAQAATGIVVAATDPERAVARIRAALAHALEQGCAEAAARIYTDLAEALRLADDPDALAATIAHGRQFCAEHGLPHAGAALDLQQAGLLMRSGELAAAENDLRDLVARPDLTGDRAARAEAWLGRVLARRGEPGAADLIHRAWDDALRRRDPMLVVDAGTALVELAWLTDAPETAEVVAEVVADGRVLPGAAELVRMLGLAGLPVTDGPGGDAITRIGRDPYERALELGLSGGPAAAEGCAALEAMGARATVVRVRRTLTARGHRVRRSPNTAPRRYGLTDRQLAVLELVAHGHTSAAIATRLGLSKRTVDHHVAAILTKLDVATRREAVAHLRAHRATAARQLDRRPA